jgi:hypothetical protein
MNIKEAVKRACEEPTLEAALVWICIWENARAVKQAVENPGSGAEGAGWDTFFKFCISAVMNTWVKPPDNIPRVDCPECIRRGTTGCQHGKGRD